MNFRSAILTVTWATLCCTAGSLSAQLTGQLNIHDPSTVVKDGSLYYVYSTGNGVSSKYSDNIINWQNGPRVFNPAPAWTSQEVPANTGHLWAPDIFKYGNEYRLYYSISSFGSQDSAIGLATNTTLNPNSPNYQWIDQGPVIDSELGAAYNAIDPNIFHDDTTNRMWITFGSFWSGIFISELNPATGKPLSSAPINIARHPVNPPNAIEAPFLHQRDAYYYLFVNWGNCCQGVNSTYEIRVGRGTSPTGPFVTRNARGGSMLHGGGEFFLGTEGNFIGPGHLSIFNENGTDYFGYHYYSATNNEASRYNIEELAWTMDGWPIPASDLIPGDFNGDKIVDHKDLAVWKGLHGTKATGQDFLEWQRNYGQTLASSSVNFIPEPSTVIILFGLFALVSRHSRKPLSPRKEHT